MEQKGQRDMLIFDELWNGAFSPCEHRYERNSDYDTVSRRISAQMDVLRQNASKRQKKVWEAYDRDLAERENLEQQWKQIVTFAKSEFLTAHANSIEVRFEDEKA